MSSSLRWEAAFLRDKIEEVIFDLNEHHRNVNIAKASGSAASVAGGILAVVGGILAIPTAGLTLPVAGAGAVLAGAGGAVTLGASWAEHIIEKHNLSDVQERWDKFQKNFRACYREYSGSDELPVNILQTVSKIIDGFIEIRTGYSLIRSSIAAVGAVRVGEVGSRLAGGVSQVGSMLGSGGLGSVAALGAQAVGRSFFALNVILIPISLVDLVRSASAANEREWSAAACKLERLKDFLDRVARDDL